VRHSQHGEDTPRAFLRFIGLPAMHSAGREVALGAGYVQDIAWLDPARVLVLRYICCPVAFDLIVVDPVTHQIVSTIRFARALLFAVSSHDRLVALTAPSGGIGPAELLSVASDGSAKTIPLDRIAAGRDQPSDSDPTMSFMHENFPGLAMDPTADHAYVIPAGTEVADVDLMTAAVTYHGLAQPVSLFGRLENWLEPAAEAKGGSGPTRYARWLGNGVVGVSGFDSLAYRDDQGQPRFKATQAGLALIDTRSWSVRMLDRRVDSFVPAGDMVLATGSSWDSATQVRHAIGLVAFDSSGARRFHVLGHADPAIGQVFRGRVYVGIPYSNTLLVLDTRSGRRLGRRSADMPYLLLDQDG
jgi:hypothetical protein